MCIIEVTLHCDHWHPFMDYMHPDNEELFLQDNASCHQAQVARNWFEGHSRDFSLVVGLPCLSDIMSIIEYSWEVVERFICLHWHPSGNWKQLSRQSSSTSLQKCFLTPCGIDGTSSCYMYPLLEVLLQDNRYYDFCHVSVIFLKNILVMGDE